MLKWACTRRGENMALFEVQRLIQAWPSLRNVQCLRDLLQRDSEVERVCLLPGHVIISSSAATELGSHTVYLFDRVPLSVLSHIPNPVTLSSQLMDVVVLDELRIGLVCSNGTVYVMMFTNDTCHWAECGSFQLNCADAVVTKAIMNGRGQLLYLVQQLGESDWNYSIHKDTLHQVNNQCQVSEHTLLLSNCPLMEFFTVSNGVWVVPKQSVTTPTNLMMYHGNGDKNIQTYIFCCTKTSQKVCDEFQTSLLGITDFRELCRKLAWKLRKGVSGDSPEHIVSMSVHPVSLYLLLLMSNGRIYQMKHTNGFVQRTSLVILKDFVERYPSPRPWSNIHSSSKPTLPLKLFVCHTYYGICYHGELRIYDSATGEFVWECDDLDHTSTVMVDTPSVIHSKIPPLLALRNQSGFYLLRCKRITDHASMFVDSLFPIATNADETTPGDFLKDGELYAAHTCDLWGLSMLASHYTVTLAYYLLKSENTQNSKGAVLPLQLELLKQLGRLFVHSPALCVALIAQYPVCHGFLVKHLNNYFSHVAKSNSTVQTTLESETMPLLKQYLELSLQLEVLLSTPTSAVDCVCSVRMRVKEIIEASQQSTVSSNPIATLRSELSYLCTSNPLESLNGIKDFMGIEGSFAECLKAGVWSPDINWRNFFASEIADKASQTSIKSTMHPSQLPVFETICNLLYHLEPNDLKHFVAYAHMVRESQHGEASFIRRALKKEYFYQRAMEAIPQPNEKSTDDQVKSYSELCLLSNNMEIGAISVLLKNKMWDSVINVLKGIKPEVSPDLSSALFHQSMVQFSKAGVLHLYLDQLRDLLPKNFSILDFIDILKLLQHEEVDIFTSSEQLSIGVMAPYILHLLSQENECK